MGIDKKEVHKMNMSQFKKLVADELLAAKLQFPLWPIDAVHAVAIVCEEAGELLQAALDFHYGRSSNPYQMRKEAAHTAAMVQRFIEHIGSYKRGGFNATAKK